MTAKHSLEHDATKVKEAFWELWDSPTDPEDQMLSPDCDTREKAEQAARRSGLGYVVHVVELVDLALDVSLPLTETVYALGEAKPVRVHTCSPTQKDFERLAAGLLELFRSGGIKIEEVSRSEVRKARPRRGKTASAKRRTPAQVIELTMEEAAELKRALESPAAWIN